MNRIRNMRTRTKVILGGIMAIIIIGAITSGSGSKHNDAASAQTNTPTTQTTTPATTTAATTAPKVKHHAKPKPTMTVSQKNAIESAQEYLASEAFSRVGLIQQLSSSAGSGFPKVDAIYAVNHIHVNWNEEAVKDAKEYLATQGFSRAGLIQQLESSAGSGFTHAQAVYGVNHTGL